VRVILLDCDGTLYDDSEAHTQFNELLFSYLGKHLSISREETIEQRKALFEKHNAVSSAVVFAKEYGLSMQEIHEATYGKLDLTAMGVRFDPHLQEVIKNLQGSVAVWSNNPRIHVNRVITLLGIAPFLYAFFGEEDTAPYRKPDSRAYEWIKQRFPQDADFVLVDDSPLNLATAAFLGWEAVWCRRDPEASLSHSFPCRIVDTIYAL